MSLAGRLEEVELAELLHFLALNGRTGKVTLTRRDGHGVVVLRQGRVVYAASSSIRETFGSILVSRGLVAPDDLAAALERQHATLEGRRLGDLLVEAGSVSPDELQEALKEQLGLVVQELCRWRSGYFRFDVVPVAASGEIGVDTEELVLAGGVATEQILLEAMTRLDEGEEEEWTAPTGPRAIMEAPFSPVLRAETWLGVVRGAAPVVPRGLLLLVRGDEARGAGLFEEGGRAGADDVARSIRLSLGEPSVVQAAVERRQTWKGAVPATSANDAMLARLGGGRPREAVVVPMLLREGAGVVFYGDDGGGTRRIGGVEELEWVLLEACLAMERDLLEERLHAFETARGKRR
jgi:hypothetical protein